MLWSLNFVYASRTFLPHFFLAQLWIQPHLDPCTETLRPSPVWTKPCPELFMPAQHPPAGGVPSPRHPALPHPIFSPGTFWCQHHRDRSRALCRKGCEAEGARLCHQPRTKAPQATVALRHRPGRANEAARHRGAHAPWPSQPPLDTLQRARLKLSSVSLPRAALIAQ